MPELPDITIYIEQLAARIIRQPLDTLTVAKPFVLRSVDPPVSEVEGRRVVGISRIGKRIVIALEGERYIVIHLMIAGRLRWRDPGAKLPPKRSILASLHFPAGVLVFTEAGTTRRASLTLVRGASELASLERGGVDVMTATLDEFAARLTSEVHTLKRALTDPSLFSGIGNAYSDEILHRARLSPIVYTSKLTTAEIHRLYDATRDTLTEWTERLRAETGADFPETVTAFRDGMSVHGRFGLPCPVCGTAVQRIRYASNETNYCARCQTGGRLLADRALSRLLKKDWPKTIDEVE
ncbi:MAG TPA: DNA-formamidopyrimidine glycosylase family protein [Gemmatimonadaceae bacterium]|nr:DNA-formamidopyrimidine glycosylase family protein [Gemmatimonadaceae bacterium]